jgi:CHASE3 domain sensor protein
MTRQPGKTGGDRDAQIDLPLPPSTLVGLIVAIIAIALIAFVTWQALRTREAAAASVSNTLEIIQQLESVLSSLIDAETGQRGYMLTGEERYLEPFSEARANLPNEIAKLQTLMERSASRGTAETIEELTRQKIDELGQTIALRRTGNTAEALEPSRCPPGQPGEAPACWPFC